MESKVEKHVNEILAEAQEAKLCQQKIAELRAETPTDDLSCVGSLSEYYSLGMRKVQISCPATELGATECRVFETLSELGFESKLRGPSNNRKIAMEYDPEVDANE